MVCDIESVNLEIICHDLRQFASLVDAFSVTCSVMKYSYTHILCNGNLDFMEVY